MKRPPERWSIVIAAIAVGRRRARRHLHDRRAEPHALGLRAPPGQRRQHVGAVGLGRPDRVEAEALGLGDRVLDPGRRARRPGASSRC